MSLKTRGALEILSHYRTEAHLVREHRLRMETPGLPLYGKNEQELVGPSLDEVREKAEMTYPIAPTLGECYLLPGQYELPSVDILDVDILRSHLPADPHFNDWITTWRRTRCRAFALE